MCLSVLNSWSVNIIDLNVELHVTKIANKITLVVTYPQSNSPIFLCHIPFVFLLQLDISFPFKREISLVLKKPQLKLRQQYHKAHKVSLTSYSWQPPEYMFKENRSIATKRMGGDKPPWPRFIQNKTCIQSKPGKFMQGGGMFSMQGKKLLSFSQFCFESIHHHLKNIKTYL